MERPTLTLKGLSFPALFTLDGLTSLDQRFLEYLLQADELLAHELKAYREGSEFTPEQMSELIVQTAPILESFVAELFNIEEEVGRLQEKTLSHDPIYSFKKHYVLKEAKRALKKPIKKTFIELNQWLKEHLIKEGLNLLDYELAVAQYGKKLQEDPQSHYREIEQLIDWCVAALTDPNGQQFVKGWVSFHFPARLNYKKLVETVEVSQDPLNRLEGPSENWRFRDGFHLTDGRMNEREVMDQVHYCVYCHKTDGDFCSKGFPVKKSDRNQGLKIGPLGDTLTGCPLDEKISEMHVLKKSGYGIAALATVMIDNPLCPATGHRICNDCMKACIYQKQEPVNIPQIETRVLTDVLDLPWGVEIYDLLTRWNPLRREQWLPKSYNGKKILIMGMGPAGFTLAHHMTQAGFAVVGTDGLKIESLPQEFLTQPIYQYSDLVEDLSDRVLSGFGGVAEYGITVRWDKNFLKLIYISLLRRPYFQVFGSVRFGGTLKVEDAWTLGFDHLAVAVGAGLPRELSIPYSMAPGMRQANDFLMALQLTGAAKESSLANLQVRLPAVVIGGGLTGIDTATEVQAYYITQVEKIYKRYQILVNHFSEDFVRSKFDAYSQKVLDEFLEHGQCVLTERAQASKESRSPNFLTLLRKWGGVTIAYRRSLQESPAYRRNHEEVIKAFEEGIYYAEGLEPKSVKLDEYGHAAALNCQCRVLDENGVWMTSDENQTLPARSIFVATGAKPNIAYEYEHRGTFSREEFNYQRFEFNEGELYPIHEMGDCKMPHFGPFTSYEKDQHRVTFLGDTHPIFHGSVVKAIASAKRSYHQIAASLMDPPYPKGDPEEYQQFRQQMSEWFKAEVVNVCRHSPKMIEVRIRAPLSARNFRPGQFYRLQNYERLSQRLGNSVLQTEALAMIGAKTPEDPDVLSFMIIERGASSRLMARLKKGEPISIMGPTGCLTKIPNEPGRTILIIGGTMAAAHLRSMGHAFHEKGHRVFYVALMKSPEELHCQDELMASTDQILWLTESSNTVETRRVQDISAQGEVIMALRNYDLGHYTQHRPPSVRLREIDQVWLIGSPQLLSRLKKARDGVLKAHFRPDVEWVTSVYGPMQCMLKGVCAQCLQWQVDPKTGKRTKAVYACSWQHQPMEGVDVYNIDERLGQNRSQEILTDLWLDYLFETEETATGNPHFEKI